MNHNEPEETPKNKPLRPADQSILLALDANESLINITKLSKILGYSPVYVQQRINILEQKGLVLTFKVGRERMIAKAKCCDLDD